MSIHYVSHGRGKPVVFFHGWGFDHQIWLSLVPFLANSYQLILVDLPGFGLTPLMGWEAFKEELIAQLPAEFAVVGWSMGGLLASRLALEEPLRANALLNIASSPQFIGDKNWPGVARNIFNEFYNNLASDLAQTLQEFVRLQLNKTKLTVPLGRLPSLEGLQQGLGLLESWDLRKDISKLSQPTAYMFGRLDPLASPKTMKTMQVIYPEFKYILFNKAAHIPFLSDTDLFVHEFKEFIP